MSQSTTSRVRRIAVLLLAVASVGAAVASAQPAEPTRSDAPPTKAERRAARAKAATTKPMAAVEKGKKGAEPGNADAHGAIDGRPTVAATTAAATNVTTLYASDFAAVGYGQFPPGWRDLVDRRPSRNWAVDGRGMLRPMLKGYTGFVVYDGALASGEAPAATTDAAIVATFTKTQDPEVFFGLATRVRDAKNYYTARVTGDSLLELYKVADDKPELLGSLVSLKRYTHGQEWTLRLAARGTLLTAILQDETGLELARVDGNDATFDHGTFGVAATTYAAAKDVRVEVFGRSATKLTAEQIAQRNAEVAAATPTYPVLKPAQDVASLNTSFEQLKDGYDVVVAGAGTGGWAAAVQAARMGASVLLLEETDWIGGQMSAAGVTAMDEAAAYGLRIVRERGIYREFHESMATYYYTLDKDPFRGDRSYGDQNTNAGYEPSVARAGLYAMIADARTKGTLHLSLRSRVVDVAKSGNVVTGTTIEVTTGDKPLRKAVRSTVLVDATEYGDVIPLTGARYRVGNVTSDKIDPKGAVQDHTWTAVIREYPQGVPQHLRVQQPPPGYETHVRAFRKYKQWGGLSWGKDAQEAGIKEFQYRVYTGYRSVPDTLSPLFGVAGQHRNTLTSINGGNDYPVTVGTIEDPATRRRDEREGIYRSLSVIYYYQNVLGAKWSVAEDQGYDTPANRAKMAELDVRPDLRDIAARLPQMPYVRESRRVIGIKTLIANDLTRFEKAKLFPTSVAMGDYFMDLHGTEEAIETDLDTPDSPKGGGPFQVPFEVFIPETVDGFVPAEKNISQSRLVSGATRMQPSTMLTGQAAGVIAALAVKERKQPRQLDPKAVQAELLAAGSTLVQRWYADVPWRTPIWQATQLLTLYGVMDRDGSVDKRSADLGSTRTWGVDEPLSPKELHAAVERLCALTGARASQSAAAVGGPVTMAEMKAKLAGANPAWAEAVRPAEVTDPARVTAGEFALVAARVLLPAADGR